MAKKDSGWNRSYSEGSVYHGLSKEQKRAFEAWLKECDHDLGSMIKWQNRGCATTGPGETGNKVDMT